MVRKRHDISTEWGQALLAAASATPRSEEIIVPLTLPEKTTLTNAAANEGVTAEEMLRAAWIDWYHRNWRRLAPAKTRAPRSAAGQRRQRPPRGAV